jgi:hypothetical protein
LVSLPPESAVLAGFEGLLLLLPVDATLLVALPLAVFWALDGPCSWWPSGRGGGLRCDVGPRLRNGASVTGVYFAVHGATIHHSVGP